MDLLSGNMDSRLLFLDGSFRRMDRKQKIFLCLILLVNVICIAVMVHKYLELQTVERVLDSLKIK